MRRARGPVLRNRKRTAHERAGRLEGKAGVSEGHQGADLEQENGGGAEAGSGSQGMAVAP
jgi:hypothetical protein